MKTSKERLEILMTPEQLTALDAEARRRKVKLAILVRSILHQHIPNYPDNMPGMGLGRKKVKKVNSL